MYPYYPMNPQAYQAEQNALQGRINQLEQARNQQMGMYSQPVQQAPTSNVNWIPVAGIEGARNQIVQPGQTAWLMDNNQPIFYVKSVDNMGSASFKAFRFEEITEAPTPKKEEDVTRREWEELLAKLGEPAGQEVNDGKSIDGNDGRK